MNHIQKMISLLAVAVMMTACGGGGGGGSAAGGGTTTKTATVAFNLVSTAKLPGVVQGITLIALLPAGTTVTTDAGKNTISASALTAGSGLNDPSPVVYGTYSAAANKVKIGILAPNSTSRGGEYARLTVSYLSTTTLAANNFTDANLPAFPLFQVAGYDVSTSSVLDLTTKMKTTLGITFN